MYIALFMIYSVNIVAELTYDEILSSRMTTVLFENARLYSFLYDCCANSRIRALCYM